ncbi:MAG: tetratricopeptide repeat protein, partial [Verrucomicrobiota bacterium]
PNSAEAAKSPKPTQPNSSPPTVVTPPSAEEVAQGGTQRYGPQFADPFPSPPSALPNDLLLAPESEGMGEAFTQFVLGVTAEESADPETLLYFRRALESDPSNARLAARLAGDLLREKKFPEAIALLKESFQAAPKEVILPVELARIFLNLRQPDNALPYAERAFKLAPNEFAALSTLVEVCSAGKLPQRIDETLRKTLLGSQKDPAFWLRAGDLFRNALSRSGIPPAKPVLERINRLYAKALEFAPTDPLCLERVGDHYALTQQYTEARGFYERASGLFTQQNATTSVGISLKWARALLLAEEADAAVELLEDVIQKHPQSPEPREFLGELYLQQGQLVAALGNLRIALDLNPAALEDHVRLIQLQLRLKRPQDAAEYAAAARTRFPDVPDLTLLLAVALGESKRHKEALEAFEKAEAEFLNRKGAALDAAFYLTYGAAAERAGILEKAAELLQKSAAMDPENAGEALNYLGFMWVDRNLNLDEAGVLIRKALGLKPNQPAYLDSLGWWYFRKGDLTAAERELRRALEKIRREDASEVYDHLGDVLEKKGNLEGALSAWEAALELDPALETARQKVKNARPAPVASEFPENTAPQPPQR